MLCHGHERRPEENRGGYGAGLFCGTDKEVRGVHRKRQRRKPFADTRRADRRQQVAGFDGQECRSCRLCQIPKRRLQGHVQHALVPTGEKKGCQARRTPRHDGTHGACRQPFQGDADGREHKTARCHRAARLGKHSLPNRPRGAADSREEHGRGS